MLQLFSSTVNEAIFCFFPPFSLPDPMEKRLCPEGGISTLGGGEEGGGCTCVFDSVTAGMCRGREQVCLVQRGKATTLE